MSRPDDVALALDAARAAARAVQPFLKRKVDAEQKADGSPVTDADRAASKAALAALHAGAKGDVVISEEEPPPPGWAKARRKWFVDPIDGTRELVAGVPEFVAMVGLVEDGAPVVGAIVDPTSGEAWTGALGEGAQAIARDGTARKLRVTPRTRLAGAREAKSRFHEPPELAPWAAAAGVGERTPCGSMGLKAVRIAQGVADFHLRPMGKCSYWDSAGPVAVLLAAGGEASDGRGRPLRFDEERLEHEGLLICTIGLLVPIVDSWAGYRASLRAGS